MAAAVSDLQLSEIKSMMSGKRKLRIPKSCYPCYKRKVKCDRASPCTLCVKRGHTNLCTYIHPVRETSPPAAVVKSYKSGGNCCHQPMASLSTTPTKSEQKRSELIVVDTQEWTTINEKLLSLTKNISDLRSQMERASDKSARSSLSPTPSSQSDIQNGKWKSEGVHMRNVLGGSPVHVGSGSVLAFLLDKSQRSRAARSVFREDVILPQLALENQSATYPFLDLWSSDIMTSGNGAVCAALPDDMTCRRFLRSYRDVRVTLYPVLPDVDQFERDVVSLLRDRSRNGISTNNTIGTTEPFGFSTTFIGVLFAALASGCQVSDLPHKERVFLCRVYVSCAYQCLRNGNYLSRPSVEAIQALLIIGDVLSYNMNPGIAYVTFGVAQRMALTLGLQTESASFQDNELHMRRQLWWSMGWQDSHFALSYDRPIETLAPNPRIPYDRESRPGMRRYFETMCRIIALTLQMLREEILSAGSDIDDKAIPAYKEELDQILADAAPHMRREDYCFTLTNHIERLSLKLRSSYLVAEICRRSLKKSPNARETSATTSLCGECIESLINTIEAYVELHEIIPHGSRSWIHLHSAISSAFLLVVDEGAQSDPVVWNILEKLERVLDELTAADTQDSYTQTPDSSQENPSVPFPTSDSFAMPFSQQNFMLSDFPLAPELAIQDSSHTPTVSENDAGFLSGTLESLRNINAGFRAQQARLAAEGRTAVMQRGKGSCCTTRCQ